MKFRKKPVVIEAFQMTAERQEDQSEWPDWLHDAWQLPSSERNALYRRLDPTMMEVGPLQIHTLEGDHIVSLNDWIIRGVKGELYPCRSDIFDMTYEALPDIADVLLGAGQRTADELEAALSSVSVMDVTEAAMESNALNALDIIKPALAAAGCTDVDEWMRVFSTMCTPEFVHLWAPLLRTPPDDCMS